MPDFQRLEKGVGLHSTVFQKPVLQANGLYLVSLAKPAPTAKDRLATTRFEIVTPDLMEVLPTNKFCEPCQIGKEGSLRNAKVGEFSQGSIHILHRKSNLLESKVFGRAIVSTF
jgi:hypothetical protein